MYKRLLLAVMLPIFAAGLMVLLFTLAGLTTAASDSGGVFYNSGQSLGNSTSHAVAAADLDGDADLDVFVANQGANRVWLNGGAGFFTDSAQSLGSADSQDIALGDLDGDGDLDAWVANSDGANRVWLNQGSGQFTAGQSLGDSTSRGVALGDLDGDGDLDAFVANQGAEKIWVNQGGSQAGTPGTFADSGQDLGTDNSYDVALGDLEGDGDLDAFVANGLSGAQPDTVWINQGGLQSGTPGVFVDSGQSLGAAWSYAVALADLDGDNDLDAFTASWFPQGNKVWLNDGSGTFSDSGQSLGSAASLGLALGDVDGDGDLDGFVANNTPDGGQVWLNSGSAQFTDSGQTLGAGATSYDGALVDLDGDGDLDIFAANFGANTVWFNGTPGLPQATFDVDRQQNDSGEDVYYHAASGDALLPVLLGHVVTQTVQVHAGINAPGISMTETMSFDPGEQLQYLNLVNPAPDPDQTYTLTLSVTLPGIPPTQADETDRLLFVFVDGEQGMKACILCFVEWLGRFVGIDSIFGLLHHLPLEEQRASPLWPYYTALFDLYAPEMADIVAANPSVLWQALLTLDQWTPAVQELDEGSGETVIVSQAMVDEATALVEAIKDEASPGLQAAIQREQDALDFPSLVNLNLDQVWDEFLIRRPISNLFMAIILK